MTMTASTAATVRDILATLKRKGTKRNVDGMARYGIVARKVFGVSVADLRAMARPYRNDTALAHALWKTGWYEARMLAAFVADPRTVTAADMDRWARDFENWAITDTMCFHLFDRSPHAWAKVAKWSRSRDEFVKRAAFALLASMALHHKKAPDAPFVKALALVERAAGDERNFVKKGVSWALRGIGHRKGAKAAALKLARSLAASDDPTRRWIGKDALRDLTR
jgi:3-methyladenine DNA glycosylase AlkD